MPMLEVYMYKYNPCFMYTRTHTHIEYNILYTHNIQNIHKAGCFF